MSAFASRSDVLRRAAAGVLAAALACSALAEGAPARVVSVNLCTDQLALMMAAPGQVVSVTYLAADPDVSAMPKAAAGIPGNRGRAEEVFLMRPEVVLADDWTDAATLSMLERLGVRVERFSPGYAMEDIRANVVKMGAVLGRQAQAAEIVAAFDARLAALQAAADDTRRAANYAPNGFTWGSRTLSGQIMAAAGFSNVADAAGLSDGGLLPLEALVMAQPDVVITGAREPGASQAEDMVAHPALRGLRQAGAVTGPDWACATPFVLDAVARLAAVRGALP
jgi:iron complex transport system substrate-binding protein